MSSITKKGESADIPNTLVERDAAGDFAAGTITASLNGSAAGVGGLTISGTPLEGEVLTVTSGTTATWAPNLGGAKVFGTITSYPIGTTGLRAMAFNSNTGDMWAAVGDSVIKVTASGAATEYPLTPGSDPTGIAFNSNTGDMWTANQGPDNVSKIDPSGSFTDYNPSGGMTGTYAIAFNSLTGDMWVACQNGNVAKVHPDGTGIVYSGAHASAPTSIAFNSNTNEMWMTSTDGTVTKFTGSGTPTTYTVGGFLTSIAFNSATGDMWATDNSGVAKIDPSGTSTFYSIPGGFDLDVIAYNSVTGDMWVASYENKVIRITPSGVATVLTVPSVNIQQFGIAANTNTGDIWVASQHASTILRIVSANSQVIEGITVTGTPSAGQVIVATSPTTAVWGPGGTPFFLPSVQPQNTSQLQFQVGPDPVTGLAFASPDLWVALAGGQLARMDPSNGNPLNNYFPTGTDPINGMTFDGTNLWLTSSGAANLYQVDLTGTVLASYTIAGATQAQGIVSDGTSLWVTDYGLTPNLYKIDPSTGALLNTYTLPVPMSGIAWKTGDGLWAVDGTSATLYRISRVSGAVISTTDYTGQTQGPLYGIVYANGNFWVTDGPSGQHFVYEIDSGSLNIINSYLINTNGNTETLTVITYDGANFWIAEQNHNQFFELILQGASDFVWTSENPNEQQAQYPMPRATVVSDLTVTPSFPSQPGSSVVVTVRKNGADTALTVTMPGGSGATQTDSTHSISFAQGDLIDVKFTSNTVPANTSFNTSVQLS